MSELIRSYTIDIYENGATEIHEKSSNLKKITYNTGDIVYFRGETVICIKPKDMNGTKYSGCENPNTDLIDIVEVPKQTTQAINYHRKQVILENLKNDEHFYDEYVLKMLNAFNERDKKELISKVSLDQVKRFLGLMEK